MQGLESVEEEIRQRIAAFNPEVFVAEIKMIRGKRNVLSILIDTDEGIKIQACARISRHLNDYFEEEDPISFPFTLEVGSPGLGNPLHVWRQYNKSIGRKLKVLMLEGETLTGQLIEVTESTIVLEPPKKKKKKKPEKGAGNSEKDESDKITIEFEAIKEAKIEISFG